MSLGDPVGVGPELALRALAENRVLSQCWPIVFGDASVLQAVASRLNWKFPPWPVWNLAQWQAQHATLRSPAIVDLQQVKVAPDTPSASTLEVADARGGDAGVRPGCVSAATGAASYAYIVAATQAALRGEVAGVVTGPIHKEAFHAAGVPHPGHTELLAELTKCHRYCMMLTSREISCSLVTCHVGLKDVPELLQAERILEVIQLTDEAMRRRHQRPSRLAVLALNPHAGEGGLFGAREEERLILPAIRAARDAGILVDGPLAPDTAFVPRRRQSTDAYICMYHDQGLIPLKALAFDTAINVTLGLPILRSSVDHGTALDIAWQGSADPTSLYFAFEWIASSSLMSGGGAKCEMA